MLVSTGRTEVAWSWLWQSPPGQLCDHHSPAMPQGQPPGGHFQDVDVMFSLGGLKCTSFIPNLAPT